MQVKGPLCYSTHLYLLHVMYYDIIPAYMSCIMTFQYLRVSCIPATCHVAIMTFQYVIVSCIYLLQVMYYIIAPNFWGLCIKTVADLGFHEGGFIR